jgi:hypothetical protein
MDDLFTILMSVSLRFVSHHAHRHLFFPWYADSPPCLTALFALRPGSHPTRHRPAPLLATSTITRHIALLRCFTLSASHYLRLFTTIWSISDTLFPRNLYRSHCHHVAYWSSSPPPPIAITYYLSHPFSSHSVLTHLASHFSRTPIIRDLTSSLRTAAFGTSCECNSSFFMSRADCDDLVSLSL